MEEDPLAKERKAQQQLAAQRAQSTPTSHKANTSESSQDDKDELATLFGELWPLPANVGDIVKLTPEVGREVMGKQLKHLKRHINNERVWKFVPEAQHWIRLRLDEEAS